MKDQAKNISASMSKTKGKVVKARLTKRGKNRFKQFSKQAQGLIDEVEVSKKSFPDGEMRSAMRTLMATLEETIEAVATIAEASGEDDIVEVLEDVASELSHFDVDETSEDEPEHEDSDEVEIDIEDDSESILDETAMNGY